MISAISASVKSNLLMQEQKKKHGDRKALAAKKAPVVTKKPYGVDIYV